MADLIIHIAAGVALLGVILASARLVAGPTAPDRTVALDTLTVISISLIVMIALFQGRVIYLDVALVYGILSFLGVIAIARYLEGGL
ncbi:MAG TPA: cation:proton antiporter [Caldithrix abyssi]|uniref:Cation:proton antiporter n=1 Tax=Caldithrix abyssi TaxID=187145 RepID=A0A7V1PWM1_CALAY|nr:cation:proton antiporter [Caldithrix abyssi]